MWGLGIRGDSLVIGLEMVHRYCWCWCWDWGVMFVIYCMKVLGRWELVITVDINILECIIAVH